MDDSISTLRRATALYPSDPRTYFHLGNVLAQLQKYDQTINYYERALKVATDTELKMKITNNMGVAYHVNPLLCNLPTSSETWQRRKALRNDGYCGQDINGKPCHRRKDLFRRNTIPRSRIPNRTPTRYKRERPNYRVCRQHNLIYNAVITEANITIQLNSINYCRIFPKTLLNLNER